MVLESLEGRFMLSVAMEDGVLTIDGTDGNDLVLVQQQGAAISVDFNGKVASFPTAGMTGISCLLGDGNDSFSMLDVAVSGKIGGGRGDDTIVGGAGNDLISGDEGRDSLTGLLGDDTLQGGPGADVVSGNQGRDMVRGGRGRDVLRCGKGSDRAYGGAGADSIKGAIGRDELFAEDQSVSDSLSGGAGQDVVHVDVKEGQADAITDAEWMAMVTSDGGTRPSIPPNLSQSMSAIWLPVMNMVVGSPWNDTVMWFQTHNATPQKVSATVDWGDGQITQERVAVNQPRFSDTSKIAVYGENHSYTQAGTYCVSVTVVADEQSFVLTTSAVVDEVPEVGPLWRTEYMLVGQERSILAGAFYRVEGDDPSDYTAVINWGDGSSTAGTVEINQEPVTLIPTGEIVDAGKLLVVRGTHSFASRETPRQAVSVLLTGHGRKALATNTNIILCEPYGTEEIDATGTSLTTLAGLSQTVELGLIHSAFNYPGVYSGAFDVSVDWGDGSRLKGSGEGATRSYLPHDAHDAVVAGTHTFAEPGDYTAHVTVDYFGKQAAFDTQIHVAPPLSLTWQADSVLQADAASGEKWSALLATFAPLHADDKESDYTATSLFSEGISVKDCDIARGNGGVFEVRADYPLHPGSNLFRVVVSGFGQQAQFDLWVNVSQSA